MPLDEIDRPLLVFVLVFLVAFLLGQVALDVGPRLGEARQAEGLVDVLGHREGVALEVLELHLDQVALGDEMFLFLIFIEKPAVDLEDVGLDLLVGDVFQAQGLDGVGEEATGALEDRVGVAHQVDELRVGIHLDQRAHPPRVRGVLAEELRPAGIPERDLDEAFEHGLEDGPLLLGDRVEEEVALAIVHPVFREIPEIVIGIGHHVREGEFFLLGQVDLQFHVVGRPFVGHEEGHVFLEKRLAPEHEVGEDGLVGRRVAEMLVAGEDVVDERRAAPPMAQDEERVVLDGPRGATLLVAAVLEWFQEAQEAADAFREEVFSPKALVDFPSGGDGLEGGPVGAHQRVDRQLAEFDESHVSSSLLSGFRP